MNKLKLSLFCLIILNISLVSCLAVTLYTLTKQATWIRHTYAYVVTAYYTTANGGHTWKVDTLKLENYWVTGFTYPNQTSTIQIILKNYAVVYHISNYEIRIIETDLIIASGQVNVNPSKTWTSPVYNFISPSAYGSYMIRISVSFVH